MFYLNVPAHFSEDLFSSCFAAAFFFIICNRLLALIREALDLVFDLLLLALVLPPASEESEPLLLEVKVGVRGGLEASGLEATLLVSKGFFILFRSGVAVFALAESGAFPLRLAANPASPKNGLCMPELLLSRGVVGWNT